MSPRTLIGVCVALWISSPAGAAIQYESPLYAPGPETRCPPPEEGRCGGKDDRERLEELIRLHDKLKASAVRTGNWRAMKEVGHLQSAIEQGLRAAEWGQDPHANAHWHEALEQAVALAEAQAEEARLHLGAALAE